MESILSKLSDGALRELYNATFNEESDPKLERNVMIDHLSGKLFHSPPEPKLTPDKVKTKRYDQSDDYIKHQDDKFFQQMKNNLPKRS